METTWLPLWDFFGASGELYRQVLVTLGGYSTRDHLGATGSPLGDLSEANGAMYHLEPRGDIYD